MTTSLKIILTLLCIVSLIVLYFLLPIDLWIENFKIWVKDMGTLGWIVFIIVYAVSTFLLIPGSFLTLAAGFLWGFYGFPIVVFAACWASCMSFLAARYLFHGWVQNKVNDYPKFNAVNRAIGDEGWKVVVLLRLSPALPFSLQNWFLGITPVGFVSSQLSTFFGILPGTLLYIWLGSLGGNVAGGETDMAQTIILIVGLLATLWVTIMVTRRAQAKLKEFNV